MHIFLSCWQKYWVKKKVGDGRKDGFGCSSKPQGIISHHLLFWTGCFSSVKMKLAKVEEHSFQDELTYTSSPWPYSGLASCTLTQQKTWHDRSILLSKFQKRILLMSKAPLDILVGSSVEYFLASHTYWAPTLPLTALPPLRKQADPTCFGKHGTHNGCAGEIILWQLTFSKKDQYFPFIKKSEKCKSMSTQ